MVTHSVLLERIKDKHFLIGLQRHAEVVKVVLGSSGIPGREKVHGTKATVGDILTEAVQTPLPSGIEFLGLANHVEVELSDIVVGIHMNAEVHPLVIDARKVASAVAACMDSAVTCGRGRVLTVVGHVHVHLNSPDAVVAIDTVKVVQHVEIAVLALRDVGIEFKIINTYRSLTKLDDLVITIGEVGSHGATSFIKHTVFSTAWCIRPGSPRITVGQGDFSTSDTVVKIVMQLSECIAANKGNHRDK